MRHGLNIVVLAGSAEARQIAQAAQDGGVRVRALISEPPRGPNPMPVPCDLHDFASLGAVIDSLRGCAAVLDASHGFDARMSRLGFEAAQVLGVPFVSYIRPGWGIVPGTNMTRVPSIKDALPLAGDHVFSATGWASLPEYAAFSGARLFLRQTSRHPRAAPYPFVELAFGNPPFTEADERATLKTLRIDTLICRDLGGRASYPKVAAAIGLGIQVILIDRPALPGGARQVTTVSDALNWISAL